MLSRLPAGLAVAALLLTAAPAPVHAAPSPTAQLRAHSPLKSAPAPPNAGPGAVQASVTHGGYIPCDLWNAYSMGTVDPTAGAGQTIAIIDPYDSASAASDFASFSSPFLLPTNNFRKVAPNGIDGSQSDAGSWIGEISLDIEWAHAIAPAAQIVLVQARTSLGSDMLAAVDYAVGASVNADAVSMSWSFAESGLTASQISALDSHFTPTNSAGRPVTYVAAAGDAGFQVNWPAVSPRVIGVGGTSVAPSAFGYSAIPAGHDNCAGATGPKGVSSTNETVWGTSSGGNGTGGGVSSLEPRPAYQTTAGLTTSGRAMPDVSMLADPATGVALYVQGAWSSYTYGGTSLGTPIWAAITARLNASRGGNLSQVGWIYGPPPSAFNDIVSGSSAPGGNTACVSSGACTAAPGCDLVTGRGSPVYSTLAPAVTGSAAASSCFTYTSYFPWFDRASDPGFKGDNIHVVNPNGGDVYVSVSIPGCGLQGGVIHAAAEGFWTCPGGFGGPVVVRATQRVDASQRVQYYQSFNEVKALPSTAAGQHLLFSWFDLASDPGFTSDNIHVLNPGGSPANVTVTIPGCGALPTRQIGPGAESVFSCAGGFGGPVKVDSDAVDHPVLATQRVKYYSSFNEVPAQPAPPPGSPPSDLWMSWFDKVSDPGFKNDNVHVIGSPGTVVHATIPGCTIPAAPIPATGEYIVSCPSGFGGPVHLTSDGGPITASQRVQYYQTFNEVTAQSQSDGGQVLWLSWFDLASDPGFTSDNVHVINPATSGGNVAFTVSIPGCTSDQSGSLGPGQETYFTCAGGFGGPIRVTASTAGAKLLAAARVKYYGSFNEVTASP